jgi:hypothetical protein
LQVFLVLFSLTAFAPPSLAFRIPLEQVFPILLQATLVLLSLIALISLLRGVFAILALPLLAFLVLPLQAVLATFTLLVQVSLAPLI